VGQKSNFGVLRYRFNRCCACCPRCCNSYVGRSLRYASTI